MTFTPARVPITGITNANPAVVTTGVNHGYSTGEVVRLHVPPPFGMTQLNQQALSITVLSPTTFSLQYSQVPVAQNVDSRNFYPFTTPSTIHFTCEALSIGAGTTPLSNIQVQIQNNICVTELKDATFNNSTTEIPF
jgi:hypothetical protein